ncbi:MAG: hypothetical protein EOO14_00340 [Chitinophagaceae bacterium]|nr:MAG: hypothetical protein EOO14_00340 [Chitinophagaceae bacterium]
MASTTVSKMIENAKKPAPRWFRKWKKAIGILTVSANLMVAQWTFADPTQALKLQLWLPIGIGAILEAMEVLLANGEDYAPAKPEGDEAI